MGSLLDRWEKEPQRPNEPYFHRLFYSFTIFSHRVSEWSRLTEIDRYVLTFGLWVGLIEMGITYILWQRALERASNRGNSSTDFYPLSSQCFYFHFLGENITPSTLIALIIIVMGTWVTQKYKRLSQDH